VQTVPDVPKSSPPAGQDPGPDFMKTIDAFKRAPIRIGCFGFMFSGWRLVWAVASLVLLIYLIRHLGS
jgi:hypothetical protein